jgi:peptidyl-tRNA hydrolase
VSSTSTQSCPSSSDSAVSAGIVVPEYDRLYIAVRADLPPGLQMAQAVHAAFHFYRDHPSVVKPWLLKSNFLVIVSVPNEDALLDLIKEAASRGITRTAVREPDIDDEATAVALAPGAAARKLCANLPLALKEPAMT